MVLGDWQSAYGMLPEVDRHNSMNIAVAICDRKAASVRPRWPSFSVVPTEARGFADREQLAMCDAV
jgi:hypothetical protein